MRLRKTAVHTITDARRSMSEDIRYRQRRYVIQMGIRTVCLIVAVTVPMPLPLRIVVVAAAIVLPYFAVVLANGGREPERTRFEGHEPTTRGSRPAGDAISDHRHETGS